ncbi:MAG: AraC family transcriptional regulator [Clostridiales bacterium]|nr:AraC family transcriptional regulator [Clostridiales bacterium]
MVEFTANLQLGMSDASEPDLEAITFRYNYEQELMKAVTAGDRVWVQNLNQKWKENLQYCDFSYRLPEDPLRVQKNNLVILNTLMRVAAYNGGLPPLYLHIISEKYAKAIERASSVEELGPAMHDQLTMEYTDAVHRLSTHGHSKKVVEILEYISANIRSELSRSSIAEAFHISSSHLSQIFKEEMGISIVQYIQRQRIDLAKYYFELGETNVSEVASLVGYTDSSYFTRVFRKVTGESPSACLASLHQKPSHTSSAERNDTHAV